MSILKGKGPGWSLPALPLPGKGQNLDTGAKVVQRHRRPLPMNTRSISKDGGISTFRSSVVVTKEGPKESRSAVSCQSLMLDTISRSDTIPAMDIRTADADVGHEAQIGHINDEAVFYLMSRGISEEEAGP